MSKISISVVLPTSLVIDSSDLRQKTLKVGLVGRALAIFRVNRVCIYNDDDPRVRNQEAESKIIETILSYMETPQYLRKLLFPRTDELRYAGLLYPLRTPNHPLQREKTQPGDYREGVVVETGAKSILEIGLPEKAVVDYRLDIGQRLIVRLGERSGNLIRVTPVTRDEVLEYYGYDIVRAKSLSEGLKVLNSDYYIGTSRRGQNLYDAVQAIKNSNPRSVAVAFGGPYAGLFDICGRQGVDIGELFDVVVNTVPNQGTSTVRTEEALFATLSLLNALIRG